VNRSYACVVSLLLLLQVLLLLQLQVTRLHPAG
jgi:hypothetical protein